MKKYFKNLVMLVIFTALFGLIGSVPKVYMKREMASYSHDHLSTEAQEKLKSGDLLSLMQSASPEAINYVHHFSDSYKKVLWVSQLFQVLLVLMFSWLISKANGTKVTRAQ